MHNAYQDKAEAQKEKAEAQIKGLKASVKEKGADVRISINQKIDEITNKLKSK